MAATELSILNDISVANQFVKRSYLNDLTEYEVLPLAEHHKKFQSIRLYKVDKLIFDKSEGINDKLVSVFNTVQNTRSALVMILRGCRDNVELYLGIQSNRDASVAEKVFSKSLLGNFPGSIATRVPQPEVAGLMTGMIHSDDEAESLTCLNVIPAVRNEDGFIQGLEKFVDTMKGEEYVCMVIASSVSNRECEERLQGYEQLYTTLYPLSNMSLSQGTSKGTTITDGYTSSISKSVTDSIAKTVGQHNSKSNSVGFHAGLFGMGVNSGMSFTSGTSNAETKSTAHTQQDSESTSTSRAVSETTNSNMTVNYKDKMVEDTLECIERRIDRIKDCMNFGMWECAAYFMAPNLQTSVISANVFRSLMLGDENKSEKSFMNLFGRQAGHSTQRALETLRYCRHPAFRINQSDPDQHVYATEYLSGKELPLLFSLPRKSVAGVTVTSMAEFGRNVVHINGDSNDQEQQSLQIGRISHMNQVEDTIVKLDLQSLRSHCFVTGSTGSGKSNTTFTLLSQLLKPENNIPFLVVEPAKGEYKYAFAGVQGINIFTTTHTSGRFLKINPFKFNPNIHVLEHLDRLIEIFNTCWEMYAAMPAILKDAIERIYEKVGWDLMNSVYIPGGEPQYPTFKDLLAELPNIINQSGYSSDTKGDYTGALVTRVNSLTNGIIGQIFCDSYDINDAELFDNNAIVDLSRVGSSETKSLIMGILVLKLTEHRMATAPANNALLRHVTILEEAHNLLKNTVNNPGGASTVVAKSVEMICNSIAEMRTSGEGFILVDQSPSSVDIAAIKNTNTKIVMRLPEMMDCESIGRSISLNEQQILELSKLRTGTAVVMQNNWCDAVLAQIDYYPYTYAREIPSATSEQLLAFKSAVISELLNQYTIAKTRNVGAILEAIERFDIDAYKKADAVAMVTAVTRDLNRSWKSSTLGKVLLQYSGFESIFRRAERKFPAAPKRNQKTSDTPNLEQEKKCAVDLVDFLNEEVGRSLSLSKQQQQIFVQYLLFGKSFENTTVDYYKLYQRRYMA